MPDQVGAGPTTVLFLCTENAAHSQIAEAFLHRKGGDRFVVGSAGITPAVALNPLAMAALADFGVVWRGQPKSIEAVIDQPWDLVIALDDRPAAVCPSLPGRPLYAHWRIPGPVVDGSGMGYQEVVTDLSRRIDLLVALRPEQLRGAVLDQRARAADEMRVAQPA